MVYYELISGHVVHKVDHSKMEKTMCGLKIKIGKGFLFADLFLRRKCLKCWGKPWIIEYTPLDEIQVYGFTTEDEGISLEDHLLRINLK